MDPSQSYCLSLELKIIRARNINLNSTQDLFVRCYLTAGSNKRVKLDSQPISSKSNNFTFNQTFSLCCLGSKDTIKCLKRGIIVFELRQRRSAPFIGRMMISGSKLLSRAEMPWNDVVDAPSMEFEKWVVMVQKTAIKPSALLIAMRVEESEEVIERKKINEWDDEHCGCTSCVECEFLAIGAALEVS